MLRPSWIFDISPSRVLTMLILKNTIKNQELFPQLMPVRTETGTGCIANQAGCTGKLIAITLEQFSLYPIDRRSNPRCRCGVNCDSQLEIGVKFHDNAVPIRSFDMPCAPKDQAGVDGVWLIKGLKSQS